MEKKADGKAYEVDQKTCSLGPPERSKRCAAALTTKGLSVLVAVKHLGLHARNAEESVYV